MTVHVTAHAIERYQERVANLSREAVIAALTTPAFQRAVELKACAVILPTGHRAILEDGCVITVWPKRAKRHRMREIEE